MGRGLELGAMTLREGGSDPSPDPRRLVKTPDAGHPLPRGEGRLLSHACAEGEATPHPTRAGW